VLASRKCVSIAFDARDGVRRAFVGSPRGFKTLDRHCIRQGKIIAGLERRVVGTSAKTLKGVIGKARALAGDHVNSEASGDVAAGDMRHLTSTARDLLAIDGRQ
jgi:hypothetical protein